MSAPLVTLALMVAIMFAYGFDLGPTRRLVVRASEWFERARMRVAKWSLPTKVAAFVAIWIVATLLVAI